MHTRDRRNEETSLKAKYSRRTSPSNCRGKSKASQFLVASY